MNTIRTPDARLAAVGANVRGDFIYDIGTDHAILPIYLCSVGKISRAVASDINRGPLLRAEKNISDAGFSDRIKTVLSDGLEKLEDEQPTDIVIAGMGGILIRDIIEKSTVARTAHLVLQPMSHAHILRGYLTENGYEITAETLARDGDKVYQIISADHTGKNGDYSEIERYLGRLNIENRDKHPELFSLLLQKNIDTFSKKVAGGDLSSVGLYNEFLSLTEER